MVLIAGAGAGAQPRGESFVVNGSFDAGMTGWTAFVSDSLNSVTVERAQGRPIAHLAVRRVQGRPPAWHTNIGQKNQRLTELEPATDYVFRCRARASTPRRLTVTLAQEYRPYRNLGLVAVLPVDTVLRSYTAHFRTDSVIPAPHEPDSSGPWLSLLADTLRGDTWIDDIAIFRAEPVARGALSSRRSLPENGDVWQGGGSWSSLASESGARAWSVRLAPNDAHFLWREVPLELDESPWSLVVELWTNAPQDLGRVSLMARAGPVTGVDNTIASTSGFVKGWNRLAFPRERFSKYWFSHFTWRNTRALALRIETNANGPAAVAIGDITVEPHGTGGPPLVFKDITVSDVRRDRATVTVESDPAATATLEYGATPAYGATLADSQVAAVHRFTLARLAARARVHARAHVRLGGETASSGDFAFTTVVTAVPGASSAAAASAAGATAPYDLGLYSVNTPDDLRRAGVTSFDPIHDNQLSSIANNSVDDARRYLDVARSMGVRVIVGFDDSRIVARDLDYVRERVRALRDHPALRGWYEFDEPEQRKHFDPGILVDVYHAIHEQDSEHPVYVCASWLGADYPYRGAYDIAMLDYYPIPYKGPDAIVAPLERARAMGDHWQFVFQSYPIDLDRGRWPASGSGPGRYPTRDEMRVMAYLALNHGAEGLWTFAYDYLHVTQGSEWKWVELSELARELRGLDRLWRVPVAPHGALAASDSALDLGLRSYAGSDYLVAVNTAPRPLRASIRLPTAGAIRVARVDADAPFEPASTATGATIRDTWRPYAVHMYRISHLSAGAR